MKKILLWLASASILLIVFMFGLRFWLIADKTMRVEESYFGDRYELMDIYKEDGRYHFVYGDDTGFSFELITYLGYTPDIWGLNQYIDCTYISAVIDSKQEELEELNQRYSEWFTVTYMEGWRYSCRINKREDVDIEDWVYYVTEYIYEKNQILNFEIEEAGVYSHDIMYRDLQYKIGITPNGEGSAGRTIMLSYDELHELSKTRIYNDLYLWFLDGYDYQPPEE